MQETSFLQAVPFCVSFVVLDFLTNYFSKSTSPLFQVLYLNSWAIFSRLSSCSILFYPSLGRRPPLQVFFSFSFTGLPIRPRPTSFSPLVSATSTSSLFHVPLLLVSFSLSTSYVPGRLCSTISSGGLGVRMSKLSLKLPPSQPVWNGKCDKWNRTRLNFVWKFQTYDVQIGS